MPRKPQSKRHSGIGSLVRRKGRWYIVGCETVKTLDGTIKKKRPYKALPADIVTRADAVREFNKRAQEARAGIAHRPSTQTVKALCGAWEAAAIKPHSVHLSTARQWTNVHGDKPLAGYTTADLVAFRKALEDDGAISRGVINAKIGALRFIVKWGIIHGYAPDTLLGRLQALPPLQSGKTTAPEGKGRNPATPEAFNKAVARLPQPFAAILTILRWTGARPSEILTLTPAEVDTTKDPWIITKAEHKTAKKGKHRVIALPEDAELALAPFLKSSPCFTARQRPISAVLLLRKLNAACNTAGVEVFTPYQLRHLRLTEVSRAGGIAMAQAAGGHSSAAMTHNYTKEAEKEKALELARAAALVGVD